MKPFFHGSPATPRFKATPYYTSNNWRKEEGRKREREKEMTIRQIAGEIIIVAC